MFLRFPPSPFPVRPKRYCGQLWLILDAQYSLSSEREVFSFPHQLWGLWPCCLSKHAFPWLFSGLGGGALLSGVSRCVFREVGHWEGSVQLSVLSRQQFTKLLQATQKGGWPMERVNLHTGSACAGRALCLGHQLCRCFWSYAFLVQAWLLPSEFCCAALCLDLEECLC